MVDDVAFGLLAPTELPGKLEQSAWRIGSTVAAAAADDVDREARFPHESVAAMREAGLLGALIPVAQGGLGAPLAAVSGAVRALAFHCASSALVLAMHTIELAALVQHGTTPALRALTEEVARDQLLLANGNSEVGVGGDIGRSICALAQTADGFVLDKQALAISYGEYADLIFSCARRNPDAAESDQILAACRRSELTLEPTSTWDTLGLRGTCSKGFHFTAMLSADAIFPVPFSSIVNEGGGQARQLLLSAVWVGLADAAAARAHAFVRAAARKSIGTTPPGALRVAELGTELLQARALFVGAALRYQDLAARGRLDDAGYVVQMRALKVSTSSLAVRIATRALEICGMSGFRRDSPYSLDRIIRDAHGGLIMVSNERYLRDSAQLLIGRKQM